MKVRFVAALFLAVVAVGPASANCQLGGSACGDPAAIDCNAGAVCFIPWRTCSNCACTTTSTGRTCLANASQPGSVATIRVDESTLTPGALELTWSASCAGAGREYDVVEGQIGNWYSHDSRACTSGSPVALTITPAAGDRYFLVAATVGDFTGSLGTSSVGAERPPGELSCTGDRAIAPCP